MHGRGNNASRTYFHNLHRVSGRVWEKVCWKNLLSTIPSTFEIKDWKSRRFNLQPPPDSSCPQYLVSKIWTSLIQSYIYKKKAELYQSNAGLMHKKTTAFFRYHLISFEVPLYERRTIAKTDGIVSCLNRFLLLLCSLDVTVSSTISAYSWHILTNLRNDFLRVHNDHFSKALYIERTISYK